MQPDVLNQKKMITITCVWREKYHKNTDTNSVFKLKLRPVAMGLFEEITYESVLLSEEFNSTLSSLINLSECDKLHHLLTSPLHAATKLRGHIK